MPNAIKIKGLATIGLPGASFFPFNTHDILDDIPAPRFPVATHMKFFSKNHVLNRTSENVGETNFQAILERFNFSTKQYIAATQSANAANFDLRCQHQQI